MLTEQQKLQVADLWKEGYSYGYIANVINSTRAAVAGHCHRNDMARANTPTVCRLPRLEARKQKLKEARKARKPVKGGVPILKAEEHHCRVIIGTGKDGLAVYCGQQKSWPTSFCELHRAQMMYRLPHKVSGGRLPRWMTS